MDGSVLRRLGERKVVQWGLAYLAGAWLLAQVFHLVGQQFEWQPSTLRAITSFLAFGFLPALVVAWHHGEKGSQHVTRTEVVVVVALLATGGAVAGWVGRALPVETPVVAGSMIYSPTRIAVLPFEDFSPDGDQQFLGNGLAETLLNVLAGIGELEVIARTSSFAYQGKDVATVARDLEVGTVLEGSVQRVGNRLRVVAQLIRTADQVHLWSLTFDRDADDIFAVQDEIAERVVNALLKTDGIAAGRHDLPRTTVEVHDLYVQGRELWQRREPTPVRAAVGLLERAVELDPDYGPAHSELATALWFAAGNEVRKRALWHISRALELDSGDAQAHAIRGLMMFNEGYPIEARPHLERALSLRPGDANVLTWLGVSHEQTGDIRAAERYFRRAFETDPMSLIARTRLMETLQNIGTEPAAREALALARQTVRLFPDRVGAWIGLRAAHSRVGDWAGAVLACTDALAHVDAHGHIAWEIAQMMNLLGQSDIADRWLQRAAELGNSSNPPFFWYIARGEFDANLEQRRPASLDDAPDPALVNFAWASIFAGNDDDAWDVLSRVIRDLAEPFDTYMLDGRAKTHALQTMVGIARNRGEEDRAAVLEARFHALVDALRSAGWGWHEDEDLSQWLFYRDAFLGHFEEAAARLESARATRLLNTYHFLRQYPHFAPMWETDAGRAYIERMSADIAAQVQRLQDEGPSWLFEPESWQPPAEAGDPWM